MKTITIEPVTKIEGHAKVTINLDDDGNVASSRFHVTEFRGFEKFCEGRMVWDMPVITTRICGICPVSHHLASAKACDDLLGVDIPPAAKKLRELMQMAQYIHSHSLHFFFLAAPDLVLGPDADPSTRSVFGIIKEDPELGKKAIKLRKIGQTMIDRVGGRAIHPVTAIPGGMSKPLSQKDRDIMLKEIDTAIELSELALTIGKDIYTKYAEVIPSFSTFETKHMGLVKDGMLELYDGNLRLAGNGGIVEEFNPSDYLDYIGEHVEDSSWLKFPFYKKEGYPEGIYRVGPLGRLNVAEGISTPLANAEFKEFKKLGNGGMVEETLYYHYARIIEMLYAAEKAKELLLDDEIVSENTRVKVDRVGGEGVGVIEAPRGTLIHHYWADDLGKITKSNMVVATIHNNPAMDMSVNEVAKNFIKDGNVTEGILNRVEMAIRCYDPCLSCSTHKAGQMPLELTLKSPEGKTVDVIRRGNRWRL